MVFCRQCQVVFPFLSLTFLVFFFWLLCFASKYYGYLFAILDFMPHCVPLPLPLPLFARVCVVWSLLSSKDHKPFYNSWALWLLPPLPLIASSGQRQRRFPANYTAPATHFFRPTSPPPPPPPAQHHLQRPITLACSPYIL